METGQMQASESGSLRAALGGVDLFASQADWDAHWAAHPQVLQHRLMQEQAIARTVNTGAAATDGGIDRICALCGTPQSFALPSLVAGQAINPREELHCSGCGLNARVRAAFDLLQRLCPDGDARIYLTEQASAAYLWMRHRYPRLIGSEFVRDPVQRLRLACWLWIRGVRRWPRFEDVTRLKLKDKSMDAVASFEVLEHVPDYRAALAEFVRVTRPGGWLVLTVPIDLHAYPSVQRARLRGDGRIEHLLEPEYHGDPLGAGVLCYHRFGWDLLDALREAGYGEAAVALPWNPDAALYSGLTTLVARR
jgi:SAM-dependent methyltransferase